ncbi:MAG: tyrosine-type recombinase/integrase [Gammaproteobacteria bacterium]|nr:tyrosine-type recombinase/integrase [Gammaproteobacteria bacterium]MYF58637.1 tyrosine-type recombinase/integrase [Gammaproteobacteria bacterium]
MAKLRRRSISKRTVEALPAGDREAVYWDSSLSGFGVRVYPSGSKVYLVQTRAGGQSRRLTVGRHGLITAEQARRKAAQIIADIKAGNEPVLHNGASTADAGPTVAEVAERFMTEHVAVRCKPATQRQCRDILDRHLLPALGNVRLGRIGRERVAALHYSLHETPTMANKVVDMLSRLFNMAALWGIAPDGGNPCRFVRKYAEPPRERFLSDEEFRRLGQVLGEVEAEGKVHPSAVAAFRLLMLTGCRKSEILTLRWEDVDLEAGELRLRDAKTGARAVAISPSARRVLKGLPRVPGNPWVIAGTKPGRHFRNLNSAWLVIRSRAELKDVRIHDLRHSFASRALALGESLPMIGKLLGHRKVQTTARYAHLARDSVKASAARVAESLRADLAGGTEAGNSSI